MSPEERIPARVRAFIAEHVHSVELLEILLMLYDHRGGAPWTVDAVNAQLRGNRDSVGRRLRDLESRGLVSRGPGTEVTYRFDPKTPELAETVDELKTAYGIFRLRIIEMIFARARTSMEAFSEAFRLKKEDE